VVSALRRCRRTASRRTLVRLGVALLTYSPLFEQYFGLKARHPDAILLARVGDFYEAYGEDAETIARLLSIALTSKDAGGERVAMAGVPHHALDGYLAKLVARRRIVALAEQMEAPVPNRLTRRDVVRIVTPGTLIEEHLLDRPRTVGRAPSTRPSPRSRGWSRSRSSPTRRRRYATPSPGPRPRCA
jgi:hypothetical protein